MPRTSEAPTGTGPKEAIAPAIDLSDYSTNPTGEAFFSVSTPAAEVKKLNDSEWKKSGHVGLIQREFGIYRYITEQGLADLIPFFRQGEKENELITSAAKGEPLHKFSEQQIRDEIVPLIKEAIEKLHDHGIYHGDLKKVHIFYQPEEQRITFIDFGIGIVPENTSLDLESLKKLGLEKFGNNEGGRGADWAKRDNKFITYLERGSEEALPGATSESRENSATSPVQEDQFALAAIEEVKRINAYTPISREEILKSALSQPATATQQLSPELIERIVSAVDSRIPEPATMVQGGEIWSDFSTADLKAYELQVNAQLSQFSSLSERWAKFLEIPEESRSEEYREYLFAVTNAVKIEVLLHAVENSCFAESQPLIGNDGLSSSELATGDRDRLQYYDTNLYLPDFNVGGLTTRALNIDDQTLPYGVIDTILRLPITPEAFEERVVRSRAALVLWSSSMSRPVESPIEFAADPKIQVHLALRTYQDANTHIDFYSQNLAALALLTSGGAPVGNLLGANVNGESISCYRVGDYILSLQSGYAEAKGGLFLALYKAPEKRYEEAEILGDSIAKVGFFLDAINQKMVIVNAQGVRRDDAHSPYPLSAYEHASNLFNQVRGRQKIISTALLEEMDSIRAEKADNPQVDLEAKQLSVYDLQKELVRQGVTKLHGKFKDSHEGLGQVDFVLGAAMQFAQQLGIQQIDMVPDSAQQARLDDLARNGTSSSSRGNLYDSLAARFGFVAPSDANPFWSLHVDDKTMEDHLTRVLGRKNHGNQVAPEKWADDERRDERQGKGAARTEVISSYTQGFMTFWQGRGYGTIIE